MAAFGGARFTAAAFEEAFFAPPEPAPLRAGTARAAARFGGVAFLGFGAFAICLNPRVKLVGPA
ncbi:MAG: hypothetical protein IT373_10850 [Polyangiaceae bacterium]|nr:hypothetical protein [Polyangiaceae bacterium]